MTCIDDPCILLLEDWSRTSSLLYIDGDVIEADIFYDVVSILHASDVVHPLGLDLALKDKNPELGGAICALCRRPGGDLVLGVPTFRGGAWLAPRRLADFYAAHEIGARNIHHGPNRKSLFPLEVVFKVNVGASSDSSSKAAKRGGHETMTLFRRRRGNVLGRPQRSGSFVVSTPRYQRRWNARRPDS